MPTATATRKPPKHTALRELEELEQAQAEAAEEASTLGREHGKTARQLQALHDERRRLIFREPGLADHNHRPLDSIKQNPVAALDKQLAEVGDLAELEAKRDHARELERVARQRVETFVAAHLAAILAALAPEGAARAEAVQAQIQALSEDTEAYLDFHRRVSGIVAAVRGDTRSVPGLDAIAELRRQLQAWQGGLPNPAELRR